MLNSKQIKTTNKLFSTFMTNYSKAKNTIKCKQKSIECIRMRHHHHQYRNHHLLSLLTRAA